MYTSLSLFIYFLQSISVYFWIPSPYCWPDMWYALPYLSKVYEHTPKVFVLFQHPYPSEEQKKQLAQDTGLTILQVNNW